MKRPSLGLVLVAVLQIIPIVIMPLGTLKGMGIEVWTPLVALFALLGVSLLLRRGWSRVASIFVQGFNILVRLLMGVSNVVASDKVGTGFNGELTVTFAISILLSAVVLYYIDQPDVQLQMQS
ncbi:MAG: hypothetical protein GXY68_11790 [Chloroflexi bacterium]|nr:hypothetical protein [Chloroflexota bacterium]